MSPQTEHAEERGLSPADFAEFFREVHGYTPFPWQESLVARVVERGWPALIDVPTGLGKTAILDVAVFLSALGSEHARRRVFLVVDRRIIVDQAHEEAEKIRKALEKPPEGGVCARVRDRLVVPGDEPGFVLDVTRMRGGVNWSWLWLERPDRHAVVTGTVDQIGTRLLFRGYGVGEQIRPIDAAMVGTDSLILIDEVHLSDPFYSTLRDVLALNRARVGRSPIAVAMSASPDSGGGEIHGTTSADMEHDVGGARLRAPKSLHPVSVNATASAAAAAVADALAHWARELGGPGKLIAVVTNTVSMARSVFERLRNDDESSDCLLLTGRVRPIDREYLLASYYPKIKSGADRDPGAELFVVATQTIEAGADIDLDGLVTQSASLSAIVQRLGRVNRLGRRVGAPVVVVHADKLSDPVYGPAASETWEWLASLASPLAHKAGRSRSDIGPGIEGSPMRLRELTGAIPGSRRELMQSAKPYVPVLYPSTLDVWARTSPIPHPDVPVAPYLHGIGVGEPTVSVIWRSDIRGDDPLDWGSTVDLVPPSADEAIELPISAVRRWLSQRADAAATTGRPRADWVSDAGTSDLESQQAGTAEDLAATGSAAPRALACRGSDTRDAVSAQELRPGDFVIVPADWGGCDRYGWHPDSNQPVTDVADFVGSRGRRAAAIRVGPTLRDAVAALAPELADLVDSFIADVTEDIADDTVRDREYRALLRARLEGNEASLPHEKVFDRLARNGCLSVIDRDAESGAAAAPMGLFATAGTSWNEDESAAGSSASPKSEPQGLAVHQVAVGRRAREFARNLGLAEPLVRAVEFAGLHHDEGKRDQRFQAMLHGGDHRMADVAIDLLAKSGMDPVDKAPFRRAARLSGYPRKMRHEALSARIARFMLGLDGGGPGGDLDDDLVVHLVAAHHGYARPLLAAIVDDAPEKVRVEAEDGRTAVFDTAETVDWAGPQRFASLCERYGAWGLALLESIVRLADIWCSGRVEGHDDEG